MIFLFSCKREFKLDSYSNEKTVKIIVTKSFEAKVEFDTIAQGDPISSYSLRRLADSDEHSDIFDWTRVYYDQYDNVLCKEYLTLEDEVFMQTEYQYFSPFSSSR